MLAATKAGFFAPFKPKNFGDLSYPFGSRVFLIPLYPRLRIGFVQRFELLMDVRAMLVIQFLEFFRGREALQQVMGGKQSSVVKRVF